MKVIYLVADTVGLGRASLDGVVALRDTVIVVCAANHFVGVVNILEESGMLALGVVSSPGRSGNGRLSKSITYLWNLEETKIVLEWG